MVRRRHVESATPYLVSLLAHAVLLALIALASRVSPVAPAPEETLSVEIVSEQQIKEAAAPTAPKADLPAKPIEAPPASPPTAPGPEEARLTPPLPQATEPEPRPVEAPPKWHAATKILSAAALSDPRNRQANDILPALQSDTRFEQLCNFEASLQIRQAESQYRPEFVVAYAMLATRVSGNVIIAEGAAFQSQGRWYNLSFKCHFSPHLQKVLAFEFAVGAPIPRSEWAAHYLPVSSQGSGE